MRNHILTALLLMTLHISTSTFGQDVEGSSDHPIITRYPGSTIGYYETQKFQKYSIATGPETGYKKIDKWVDVEGKLTRIYYIVSGQTTLTEVYLNYKSALIKSGFKLLTDGSDPVSGTSKEVGGRGFLGTFYSKNPFPPSVGIKINKGSATSAGACYIAAQYEKSGNKISVVIGGSQYSAVEKVYLVDIIEQSTLEDDLIKINADQLLKSLKDQGRATLYGIYFDFDKSEIKPESSPTLEEISKLLKENPNLNLYVVGHTDMKGSFEYNMTLSKNRAAAIVKELAGKYGITPSRLSADGVGPLAPVASNETEEGRKLNRRVELVMK